MKAIAKKRPQEMKSAVRGPSLYEVEYLRQLKEELETFLKSRSFSTIQEFQIGFAGNDYNGLMQIKA